MSLNYLNFTGFQITKTEKIQTGSKHKKYFILKGTGKQGSERLQETAEVCGIYRLKWSTMPMFPNEFLMASFVFLGGARGIWSSTRGECRQRGESGDCRCKIKDRADFLCVAGVRC